MDKYIAKFYAEIKKDLAGSDEEKVRRALRLCFAEVMVEERERCAKTSESLYDVTYWDDPVAGIAAKIRAGVQ